MKRKARTSSPVEVAEVPGERAFGYMGLQQKIHARSGAHAATVGARDESIAERFRTYFHEKGIDHWRSLGCGTPMSTVSEFPEGPGIFAVQIVERRLFIAGSEQVKQSGQPFRFAAQIELQQHKQLPT